MEVNQALARITAQLLKQGYIADRQIGMTLHLAKLLQKPVLLEGPAGVGKTEIAKVLATLQSADLIRLQCYEGLDANQAIYEWNYQRQLLYLKMSEQDGRSLAEKETAIFGRDFLLERPLLKAISGDEPKVLLIDELDRADEEFESFLLEILSDWQISIPEVGTIKAERIPAVIITSNRTRELSDALRRRCLYLWIDYPDAEKEVAIIRSRLPQIDQLLAEQIGAFMAEVRQQRLEKVPGIAETLDWATTLAALHIDHLDKAIVEDTLGVILKDWKDVRETQDSLSELFERVGIISKVG
ncbi:MAG: MoxR family ATPase [Bacteroidota bacterium]